MCGICGYSSKNVIEDSVLIEMNDTMIHRGPNDSGIWQHLSNDYAVGFAQRRLSILDLSELGHQPMISADGQAVITYNGEVYNFKELRDELSNKGYSFKSDCDTEVILSAYLEWDTDCFKHFNGMFAIAIYDMKHDRLVLARDRMGKKPLYYYKFGNEFIFASELKPIIKCPSFTKEIDLNSVGIFLCNKCIQAPKSIFKDTYKLEPGKYLIYDLKTHEAVIDYYWDLLEIANNTDKSIVNLDEAKEELRNLLEDSISKRLVADVPVGTFLSGGIDSTLVTAIAQKIKGSQIDSYTIGFYDKERNEAPYAKDIAKYLGTNHHEKYMSDGDIIGTIKDIPRYYDEPFSDASELPSMLVSGVAAENMTVILSGDGGDELFCGYNEYDRNYVSQLVDWMGAVQYSLPWNKLMMPYFPSPLRAFVSNRSWDYKSQLFIDVTIEQVQKIIKFPISGVKSPKEQRILTHNHQERRMLLDMVNYMPNDILTKMDRASMRYSLETRCPIIDYRLVEWSFKVDHSLKYHHGSKKYLLKELTYDYVPKNLLDRPKSGFGVPLRKWLRTVLKDEIIRVSNPDRLNAQGIFNPKAIEELISKQATNDLIIYSSVLWSFYVFQIWYDEYMI